ncbi:A-kinase anchor protein 3 [Chelonia mydas]|uniref:A-kinase anchor protein 3 n=1 Tax=Chelonia mydas TaxID=8469 RepID=M7C228_CHEMY|nr:A-kinase anchor protein 3 [Chelonia mydas]
MYLLKCQMTDNIDWLQSQNGLCKVDRYTPGGEEEQNWTTDSAKFFKQAASDPLKVLSWLRKDLERCALGIQDVLKSTSGFSVYDEQFSMDVRSNSGSPDFHMEMKATSSQKEPKDIEGQLTSADTKQGVDEVSFYVNRLSNLVIAMARKEINDKTDGTDKCIHKSLFASLGEPGHKAIGVGTNEGKNNPSENSTHITMKETKYEENPSSKKKTFFYKVDEQSSVRNEQSNERRSAHSENRSCHHKKRFGPDEFTNTLSKGILVYANNVVSDMMVSVMKTMKVEVNDSSIACVVLKKVILKHSKEVVSDLIDSCMKNLHNVTGTLMTDSDFVSAVKRSLFSQGSHKAAEIVQAMLNRLHTTLIVQKPAGDKSQSQSLAYASVKTGSRAADAKAQNLRFSATKTETVTKEKEKENTCAETVGNHIIKHGLTLWHQNQQKCNRCSKSQPSAREAEPKPPENPHWSSEIQNMTKTSGDAWAKDLIVTALLLIQYHLIQQENAGKGTAEGGKTNKAGTTSFGFLSHESHEKGGCSSFRPSSAKDQDASKQSDESGSQKSELQKRNPENDMSSVILMLIRKLINETGCKIEGQQGNSMMDETNRNPGKTSEGHAFSEVEQSCEEAISGLTKMITDQFDISGKEGGSGQFVDSLVDTVTKLCLMIAKYSNPESALAEIGDREDGTGSVDSKGTGTAEAGLGSGEDSASGRKVVVVNQNPSESLHNKQLQALLQWVAASQTNVPVLYFLDEDDEFLNKLQQLSSIAVEKGYSVGEVIQAVLKYEKEKQLGEALGNFVRLPVLDWLLNNLTSCSYMELLYIQRNLKQCHNWSP